MAVVARILEVTDHQVHPTAEIIKEDVDLLAAEVVIPEVTSHQICPTAVILRHLSSASRMIRIFWK